MILAFHLVGAVAMPIIFIISIVKNRFRLGTKLLFGSLVFQVVSGAALALQSGASPRSYYLKLGVYLIGWTVLEGLLLAKSKGKNFNVSINKLKI